MGQCVSSDSDSKDPDSGSKYLQPSCFSFQDFPKSSSLKEIPQIPQFNSFDQNFKTSSFAYGGEKEAFYDTQPWLDSDCEDDFYSVNDFTPSCGTTPARVSFASPEVRRSPYFHSSALTGHDQSPRKKSLSDLFEESGRYVIEEGISGIKAVINCNEEECAYASATDSPCVIGARSSYSGQITPEGNMMVKKVNSLKSVKCCLPQLLLSQSLNSSRKSGIRK